MIYPINIYTFKWGRLVFTLFGSICSFLLHAQDTIHLHTYVGNLKKLPVTIGDSTYTFLFDSGGGETFISPGIIRHLNKSIYGLSTGFRMHGDTIHYQKCDSITLNLDGISIFHHTTGVWDIMNVLPKELPPIDGIISLKSFQSRIITIDLNRDLIILESARSYRNKTRSMVSIPGRFANGVDGNESSIFLNIPKNNHAYWFLFDCGNLDQVLLSAHTALSWGIPDHETKTSSHQINFKLGDREFNPDAKTDNIIYDGVLNFDTLSQAIFLIHFPKKEIWIK